MKDIQCRQCGGNIQSANNCKKNMGAQIAAVICVLVGLFILGGFFSGDAYGVVGGFTGIILVVLVLASRIAYKTKKV